MQIIEVTQGSQEWLAHRAKCWNASDAPAMMGVSPYKTRAEFLRECATGIVPEVDAATQRRFDDGHRFEALARPLAERILGEDLYPVSGTHDTLIIGGRPVAASFDGLTMGEEVVFEHKKLNADLRAAFDQMRTDLDGDLIGNGVLSPLYTIQMEQQLLVSDATVVLFVASEWADDGTLIEERHCWYRSDPDLRAKIIAGWKQFAADLDAWKPAQPEPVAPAARAPEQLPALLIEVTGAVTASNLAEFKATALTAIRSVNRDLKTDQDFADAGAAVKWCGEVESRLKAAKEHALSQTASIDLLFKTMDDIGVEARAVRLELDKLIKTRTEARKHEIVDAGIKAYGDHVRALNERLGKPYMPVIHCDFAGAIKGMRSFTSIQNAVDAELARVKIESSGVADRIQVNLNYLRDNAGEFKALFADTSTIVLKAPEDLQALVTARISEHRAEIQRQAEAAAERERDRIRREEQAAAEARAREEAAARERQEREARDALERQQRKASADQDQQQSATHVEANPFASTQVASQSTAPMSDNVVQMRPADAATEVLVANNGVRFIRPAAPPPDDGKRLKLGEINALIAPLSITADGMAALGFNPVAVEKAARLYRASDRDLILAAMVDHLNRVRDTAPMAA